MACSSTQADTPEAWADVRDRLGLPETVCLDLLRQAFCHASYSRERDLPASACNQRLEFLGDAVLDLILVEHLFRSHGDVPEGQLTKMKATAVRSQSLARLARQLGLGNHLLLGRGEEETGGRQKSSLLADCFEALIGAVCLSTGLQATREFVLRDFGQLLQEIEAKRAIFDYKTALQEFLQERVRRTPAYRTVDALGPPHDRTFVVEVIYNNTPIGRGEGSSKQAAQQSAAKHALETQDEWLPDPDRE